MTISVGFEWLDDLPSSWTVVPSWSLFRRVKRSGHPNEELLSVYRDHGVVPKSSRDDNHNVESEDLSFYQLVNPGDLVMNKMKAWQGSIALSQHRGIVSPAYFVFEPLHTGHHKYFHYLLRSQQYIGAYNRISKGVRVGQWDLDPTYFRTLPIPVPPLEEQKAIGDFLDRELTQIDLLIEKQKSLITLLEQRFNNEVETQVVGGDSQSDSWLANLPEGWKQVPLRAVADFAAGGTPDSDDEEYWLGSDGQVGIPWLGIGDFVANGAVLQTERLLTLKGLHSRRLPLGKPGTILYAMYASVGSVSKLGIEGSWSQAILGVTPKNGIDGDYLYWALRAVKKQLPFYYRSNTQNNVNANQVKSLKIPFPPQDRQKNIAKKLEASSELTQISISKCSEFVQKLQLKRAALISAAITGKIDVRGMN